MKIMSKETNTSIIHAMMIRTTDGDGPYPVHPNEVKNYRQGGWVLAEMEADAKRTLHDYSREELFQIATEYEVETKPTMKDEDLISAIRASAVCLFEQAHVSEAVAMLWQVNATAKANFVQAKAKAERFRLVAEEAEARLRTNEKKR
jgi:hypothetical protein